MKKRGPLVMAAYGIGVLPLINNLKLVHPDVTRTYYADDADTLGTFGNIKLYFNSLKYSGLVCGYYPDPSKIFLIVHTDNPESGKQFFLRHGFKFCIDAHNLGGFIGDDNSKRY